MANRIVELGTVRGPAGPKGDTPQLSVASTEIVPTGQPARVEVGGTELHPELSFFLPPGIPGTNAVPTAEAVAAYGATSGNDFYSFLRNTFDTGRVSTVFVHPGGDDANAGRLPGKPKRTIAAALTQLGANTGVVRLLPSTAVFELPTSGIVLDVTKHSLVSDDVRAKVRFTGTTGTAIKLTASVDADASGGTWPTRTHDFQNATALQNIQLIGPWLKSAATTAQNTVGVELSVTEPIPEPHGRLARVTIQNVSVSGFGTGELLGDNAFMIHHFNFDMKLNYHGLRVRGSNINAGENISYFGGGSTDNIIGIAGNYSADIFTFGFSLDYNELMVQYTGVHLYMVSPHIEAHTNQFGFAAVFTEPQAIFQITEGSMHVSGGVFVMVGAFNDDPSPNFAVPYIVRHTISAGIAARRRREVVFSQTTFTHVGTTTGRFAEGANAQVKLLDIDYAGGNSKPPAFAITHPNASIAIDSQFERPFLSDSWFVYADGPAGGTVPADPFNGVYVQLASSTDNPDTGSRSLRVTLGASGVAVARRFAVAYPVRPGQMHGFEMRVRPAASGNLIIGTSYLGTRDPINGTSYGRARVEAGETANGNAGAITVPMTGGGYQTVKSQGTYGHRAPDWATHYVITFIADSINPGVLNIDNLYVTTR